MTIQKHRTIEEYEMIEELMKKCLLSRPLETIITNIKEAKKDET